MVRNVHFKQAARKHRPVNQHYFIFQILTEKKSLPENIGDAIEHAVAHDTEFHQFMLYTPVAGTPLFEEHRANNTLLDPDCQNLADTHGQLRFVHKHPNIPPGQESDFLIRAFTSDFQVNGPSVVRMARSNLRGWKKYGRHPDLRIRRRFVREAKSLHLQYPAVLWATRRWYRNDPVMFKKVDTLLREVIREFGLGARLAAILGGRIVFRKLLAEAATPPSESPDPPTFYERYSPQPLTDKTSKKSSLA